MSKAADVASHYENNALITAIEGGLRQLGKSRADVGIDDLGPVDEFHVGGREASLAFFNQLPLTSEAHVLDVGCGIGGPARFVAETYGSEVAGIDLTASYIETGNELCTWLGLDNRVSLTQGSALEMPYTAGQFDCAYMMHVGMNIADKAGLFAEVARVLKPAGTFGIYDIMQIGDGELDFPVPWATTAETSAVVAPHEYKSALAAAGFTVTAERNRHQFAIEFFEKLRARTAQADGPPPLGLHLLMGANTPQKISNMLANVTAERIAPVELIATLSED